MDLQLIGERIKCLREDLDITVKDMAALCEMTEEDYLLNQLSKLLVDAVLAEAAAVTKKGLSSPRSGRGGLFVQFP